MKPIVAIVKSDGHHHGVLNALGLLEDKLEKDLRGKTKILIKPNFVSTKNQLAATHVDAIKAVLDVISKYHSGKVTIGEGPAGSTLKEGLTNFNYFKLEDEYKLDFLDLNQDSHIVVEGFDHKMKPFNFHISKSVIQSDYRISVAVPKTHNSVIVTLSIKNMVVGSIINHSNIHRAFEGYKGENLNIAKLAPSVMPNLSVIDGFLGMERNGPISGDPLDLGVAAASFYPVSLDAVMSKIMGFNPFEIGYLYHLSRWNLGVIDIDQIETIGVQINDVTKRFKPHPNYGEMLKWKTN